MSTCSYCDESDALRASDLAWTRADGLPQLGWRSNPGWSRPGWAARPHWVRPGWRRLDDEAALCAYCNDTGEPKMIECRACCGLGYSFQLGSTALCCLACQGGGKYRIARPLDESRKALC